MRTSVQNRVVHRNINVADIVGYRLPAAGWVSILHRLSGLVMFVLLPLIVWMFGASVESEISYGQLASVLTSGVIFLPGWLFKLAALALIWSYLHHLIAGLRHLWMDATHAVTLQFGRTSAVVALVLSTALTAALGVKLFVV